MKNKTSIKILEQIEGVEEVKALKNKLITLRNEWSLQAEGIEKAYSKDSSAAKVFRSCIGDLYRVTDLGE